MNSTSPNFDTVTNNLSLTFYCLSGGLDPPLSLADKKLGQYAYIK